MEKIVVLAIPVYFVSLFLEAWLSYKKQKSFYHFKDSLSNLGTGILMQILDFIPKGLLVWAYTLAFEHLNLMSALGISLWSDHLASWIIAFFLTDLVYYFFHRHSHEINFLWSAHMVHHSSEEYNFSVALRQSIFQGMFSSFYLALLAVIGLPIKVVLSCYGINLIYQFFIHTRFIGKLGVLEVFLNTPSHHRVHHARQKKYLDCNYAGVFIIWDKIFGSFIEEEQEPKYGIYPRFQSYNPVNANARPIRELVTYFNMAQGKEKLFVLFKGPQWLFGRFKQGQNLNILETKTRVDLISFSYFLLALGLALYTIFVPGLAPLLNTVLVIIIFTLLGLMSKRLDHSTTNKSA